MKGRFLTELRRCLAGLRDLFFERNCVVCGGALASGGHFVCRKCLSDIPLTYFWTYSENAMMDRLGKLAVERNRLDGVSYGGPGDGGPGYGRTEAGAGTDRGCHIYNAAALFFYRHESPYCEIVRQFKYGRREDLGLWAARMLGGYLAGGGLYDDVRAVVPVPLHWFKRWRRGFNQAEIIARGVAERLGSRQVATDDYVAAGTPSGDAAAADTGCIPVVADLLRRRRYTSTQTRRGAASRRQNIRGAFEVNPEAVARLKASGVRHLLLVDDVLTTGATLSESVRLLQDHFTVSVATLGFVE